MPVVGNNAFNTRFWLSSVVFSMICLILVNQTVRRSSECAATMCLLYSVSRDPQQQSRRRLGVRFSMEIDTFEILNTIKIHAQGIGFKGKMFPGSVNTMSSMQSRTLLLTAGEIG